MLDAARSMERQLLGAVEFLGRLRQHLADPVGRHGDERRIGHHGEPLAPPAGQIGHDDVVAEVELGFVQDQPAARAAAAAHERRAKLVAEHRPGGHRRTGGSVEQPELAADDLGDHVLRRVDHILIRGTSLVRWLHGGSLAGQSDGRGGENCSL
ncbi:MAG TPA: hypothetical protein VK601_29365 [Kofleriaceae bacterium]|nr:hypothetical protein [Kofleriaceae bacterium]